MRKTIMGALLLLLFLTMTCCHGCSVLGKLPDKEFKSFQYDRAGFGGEGHIKATDCCRVDGVLTIGDLEIKEVGPWGSVMMKIKGYRR